MTISEFEQEFMGHVPEIMGAKAHYAVLVPLVEWRGEVHVLFEVRADTLERQPGEVCFPGGHMEPGESPTECAFRETWEELGIPASAIRPIARLDDVYMPRGDLMHPVMAQVETGAVVHMTASADEVKETSFGGSNRWCTHIPWSPRWGRTFPMPLSAFRRATAGGEARWRSPFGPIRDM